MASPELSRRVEKVVSYTQPCDMSNSQRREFHEATLNDESFEDLPGRRCVGDAQGEEAPLRL